MSSPPSIPDFFAGRSILITGVTGFLGKILLEKILRSCPDVKNIYMLIRHKKGKDCHKRLEEIFETKLFDLVKTQMPEFKCKCIAIEGDIIKEDLGLSREDKQTLEEEVSVVFHSAATVKFDEEMKLSVEMNVQGVASLLKLSKSMQNLVAFVHISTAFANCDKQLINEEIYPPPLQHEKLLSIIEWMDSATLDTVTPRMIGSRPNTYTYTKAVAEHLIKELAGTIPVAIFRPSIIGATYREPIQGWVDNLNGPTGLLAAIGKGVLRSMKGDFDAIADIIPADLVTNMLIAVAWYTGTHRVKEIKVFNCTSGQLNKLTWGQVERMSYEFLMKNPLENVARIPNPRFTKNVFWHDLNVICDQLLPAYVMDFYMWLSGRKRMFVRMQNKLHKAVGSVEFFTSNNLEFTNHNLIMLHNTLLPEDRKEFNFHPKCIDWPVYMENYCLGTKQYVLKEPLSQLPMARKQLDRLRRLHFVFNAVVFIFILRLLVSRVQVARAVWNMILGWAVKLLHKFPGFIRSA